MGRIWVSCIAALLFLTLGLTGCGIVTACPAIGWSNTATIQLEGNVGKVAVLQVCADGACASSLSLQPSTEAPLSVVTDVALPPVAQTPEPGPGLLFISRVDDSSWSVSVGMTQPASLTFRALSATGEILEEQDIALQWRQVGGSEQCGGPSEAGSVTLTIPS